MKQLSTILYFALITSATSLGIALTAEYGFGLKPCHLCTLQRIPYAVIIIISAIALVIKLFKKSIIILIILLFITEFAIAAYHMSVEKNWIQGPSGCTATSSSSNQSLDDYLKKIQQAPIVACDQPQWDFYGITMAGANSLWAFILAIITYVAMQHFRREKYA